MKKHVHKYRLNFHKSVVGLKHCWFTGKCRIDNCGAEINNRFVDDIAKLKRSSYNYWLEEEVLPFAEK